VAACLVAAGLASQGSAPLCPQAWELRAKDGATRVVVCAPGRPGAPLRGPARLLFGLGVDPNRADARTLEVLPAIGPARAAAWLRERERAPFCQPADLERVTGIGPRTRRSLEHWLEFHPGLGCGRDGS
jgi:hypothetical protein